MIQNTKLLNFGKALRRLETFCSEPIQNDRDEAGWLLMIHDRNLTSHTYREEFAHEVAQRIIQSHLPLFQKCFKKCEETELKQQSS